MNYEEKAKEIVDEIFESYKTKEIVRDILECKYSPLCDGEDAELWSEIKHELTTRGVSMNSVDKHAMRMRTYNVTIREIDKPHQEILVDALSKRHAHELAAVEFANAHKGLDFKKWYIAYDRTYLHIGEDAE